MHLTPNDPELWPPAMTRLAAVLALAAGPAWAGEARPVTSDTVMNAAMLMAVLMTGVASLVMLRRIRELRLLGLCLLALALVRPALPDAYDEPGGWSDLVCPPGIETAQLDALDVSPDAGVLLPPGLDPARFVTPEPWPVTPSGLTPPTQPAEPGTPTPVPLPTSLIWLVTSLATLAVAGWTLGRR